MSLLEKLNGVVSNSLVNAEQLLKRTAPFPLPTVVCSMQHCNISENVVPKTILSLSGPPGMLFERAHH